MKLLSKRDCINSVNVMPETGDFFIFPTMLTHWVFPFKSNATRISVSGNFGYTEVIQYDRVRYRGDKIDT